MWSSSDIGFLLNFMASIPAVSELPVGSQHLRHDARTADKGHDDQAHILQIDFGGITELLLSSNRQLFGILG